MAVLPPVKPSCFKGGGERSRTATALPQLFVGAPPLTRSLIALNCLP